MTEKQKEVMETLFRNAEKLSFGSASVELKIHAGKCVNIIYTTSENTREKENGKCVLEQ
jgi:hypothetical protein